MGGQDGCQVVAACPGAPGGDDRDAGRLCRTSDERTLDRYVVPMLHDPSAVLRGVANAVLDEELEHQMIREART